MIFAGSSLERSLSSPRASRCLQRDPSHGRCDHTPLASLRALGCTAVAELRTQGVLLMTAMNKVVGVAATLMLALTLASAPAKAQFAGLGGGTLGGGSLGGGGFG